MKSSARKMAIFAVLAFFVAATGCGGGPKLHAVTGTVTYKGTPVVGADVTLTAVNEAEQLKPARGVTDEQGKFQVKTFFAPGDDRIGAMPGLYKITLQKIPPSVGIVDPYKPGGMPKNELPAKYASALRTPFEKAVSAESRHFELELVD